MAPARFSVECQSRLSNGRLERANYAQVLYEQPARLLQSIATAVYHGVGRLVHVSCRLFAHGNAPRLTMRPSGSPDDKRCIVHVTGVTLPVG